MARTALKVSASPTSVRLETCKRRSRIADANNSDDAHDCHDEIINSMNVNPFTPNTMERSLVSSVPSMACQPGYNGEL